MQRLQFAQYDPDLDVTHAQSHESRASIEISETNTYIAIQESSADKPVTWQFTRLWTCLNRALGTRNSSKPQSGSALTTLRHHCISLRVLLRDGTMCAALCLGWWLVVQSHQAIACPYDICPQAFPRLHFLPFR